LIDRVASAAGPAVAPALRKFVVKTFGPALRRAGLSAKKNEAEHERLRRAELLGLVGLLGEDAAVVRECKRALRRYLRAPRSLEANLVGPVVVIAARHADLALHRRYLRLSQRADTPQEKRRFRMALAEMRDPACVKRTLALCLTPEIPTQDVALVLARMLDNPYGREATWDFIRERFLALRRRVPGTLIGRVIEATPALQGETRRREVAAFFRKHPIETAARALAQADERFRLDAALRERAAPALASFLNAL
jgi:hypothetical protein